VPSSNSPSAAGSPSSRRKRQRPPGRPKRVFVWIVSVVCLVAFGGGFVWRTVQLRNEGKGLLASAKVSPDPAARANALRELDEALRARHEKRTSGALAALDRARRADSSLPGLRIAFAEIAFNEQEFSELRKAAALARTDANQAAAASVLLGVEKWLSRGGGDREMLSAADSASSQFAEATQADLFAPAAWYFWADVLRYAGREEEGRDAAFRALCRYQPWDSADLISAKAILASGEAGDSVVGGLTFLPASPWVQAVADSVGRRSGPDSGLGARTVVRHLRSDPHYRTETRVVTDPGIPLPLLP
jgi:hypothetical protein